MAFHTDAQHRLTTHAMHHSLVACPEELYAGNMVASGHHKIAETPGATCMNVSFLSRTQKKTSTTQHVAHRALGTSQGSKTSPGVRGIEGSRLNDINMCLNLDIQIEIKFCTFSPRQKHLFHTRASNNMPCWTIHWVFSLSCGSLMSLCFPNRRKDATFKTKQLS